MWYFLPFSLLRMVVCSARAHTHTQHLIETWSPLATYYSVVSSMPCTAHTTPRHALFQLVLSISVTGFSWFALAKMQYSVGSYFSVSPRLIVERSCGDWPMQMCVNCAEKFNKEEANARKKRAHTLASSRRREERTHTRIAFRCTQTRQRKIWYFFAFEMFVCLFLCVFSTRRGGEGEAGRQHKSTYFFGIYVRSTVEVHTCLCMRLKRKCTANKASTSGNME